jgi:hypothetical protein
MKKSDNIINESTENCPTLEQLSDLFDNKTVLPVELTKHIQVCPACKQKLSEFRMLELTLKRHLITSVPENLIADIKAGVHRKLDETETPHHDFPRMFLKIAAAFVIISFAIFYSTNIFRTPTVKRPAQRIYPVKMEPTVSYDNDHFTPYYSSDYSGIMPGVITENSIPLNNIVGANYGGNREPVFQVNNLSNGQNSPVTIAPSVHQVWIATKPEKAALMLNKNLHDLKVAPFNTKITEENGEFSGTVNLTKMQLVKLVRLCKQDGMDLLSPQAPQPEHDKFSGKPDTRIIYRFDIVSPGK